MAQAGSPSGSLTVSLCFHFILWLGKTFDISYKWFREQWFSKCDPGTLPGSQDLLRVSKKSKLFVTLWRDYLFLLLLLFYSQSFISIQWNFLAATQHVILKQTQESSLFKNEARHEKDLQNVRQCHSFTDFFFGIEKHIHKYIFMLTYTWLIIFQQVNTYFDTYYNKQ